MYGWEPPEFVPEEPEEQAALTVVCDDCQQTIPLGRATATLILVRRHLYMSYARVECPLCHHEFQLFLDADDPFRAKKLIQHARDEGWGYFCTLSTPAEVISQYEEAAGFQLLQPLKLDPHDENSVAVLRWELESATVRDILEIEIEKHLL